MSLDVSELTRGVEKFCSDISPLVLEQLGRHWPMFQWELSYKASGWYFVFNTEATININDEPLLIKRIDQNRDLCRKNIDVKLLVEEIANFLGKETCHALFHEMFPYDTDPYVGSPIARCLESRKTI